MFCRRASWRSMVPSKPARQCRIPTCPNLTLDKTGFCVAHVHLYKPFERRQDRRPSSTQRGYGRTWQAIRIRVLVAHGIPEDRWPEYDIDHNPPYNPAIEPDHNKYQLTPKLHGTHSRKTVREDGGWGQQKAHGPGGDKSLPPSSVNRLGEASIFTREFLLKGVEP